MILAVASGKGGTGKTTIATNLARCLGSHAQLIDCDVEEPNAHLFLRPVIERVSEVTLPVPEVDLSRCTYCGQCAEFCRFSALVVVGKQVLSFPEMCHGCGGCGLVCPEKAIGESPRVLGIIEEGVADGVAFVHGRLRVGEAMSPPLIRAVRRRAMAARTVILDAPPGTSCPVIAAVRDTDYCVMVTEPTPFGINDLMLAVDVVRSLGIPHGVVVNRSDLDSDELHELCRREGLPILLEIPEDRGIAEVYSRGEMIVDVYPSYRWDFLNLFQRIQIDLAKVKARGLGRWGRASNQRRG